MRIVGYVPADSGIALCEECAREHAREHGLELDAWDDQLNRWHYYAVTDISEDADYLYCDNCLCKLSDC